MRRRLKVKKLRSQNQKNRVQYTKDHKSETVNSFWQFVCFTNKAHVDSDQMSRICILREEDIRLNSNNMQKMSDTQKVKLHMIDFIFWHHKDSLISITMKMILRLWNQLNKILNLVEANIKRNKSIRNEYATKNYVNLTIRRLNQKKTLWLISITGKRYYLNC